MAIYIHVKLSDAMKSVTRQDSPRNLLHAWCLNVPAELLCTRLEASPFEKPPFPLDCMGLWEILFASETSQKHPGPSFFQTQNRLHIHFRVFRLTLLDLSSQPTNRRGHLLLSSGIFYQVFSEGLVDPRTVQDWWIAFRDENNILIFSVCAHVTALFPWMFQRSSLFPKGFLGVHKLSYLTVPFTPKKKGDTALILWCPGVGVQKVYISSNA